MLVNIIPLRRLPRSFEAFTYQVPEELQKLVQIGQLVSIPFRKSQEFGIIFSLHLEEKQEKLKFISGIAHVEPMLSAASLEFFKKISTLYGISMGALLEISLPEFGARTIKKNTSDTSPDSGTNIHSPSV